MPLFLQVWRNGWHTASAALLALLVVLFSGYSPNMAAFIGLMLCIVVGFTVVRRPLTLVVPGAFMAFIVMEGLGRRLLAVLAGIPRRPCVIVAPDAQAASAQPFDRAVRQFPCRRPIRACGRRASAAVGIVVGVINTTGVAFRLGFMVTNGARDMADFLPPVSSAGSRWRCSPRPRIQQFLSLVLIAIACIFMGAGLPTTALYIMLVSVAQPALAQLGVPALATHMFVLYYGVISEITPVPRPTPPRGSPGPTPSAPASTPSRSGSAS